MNVVFFAPSGALASALDQLALTAEDTITAVTACKADAEVTTFVVVPALRKPTAWAQRRLAHSAAGRNLLLLRPLAAGRRFAGAVRRNRDLRQRIREADMLVVLERDGILAGWRAARRWTRASTPAVYGIPPAQAILAGARR